MKLIYKIKNKISWYKIISKRYVEEKNRNLKDFFYKLSLPRKICPLCGKYKLSTIYNDSIPQKNIYKKNGHLSVNILHKTLKDKNIIGFKCPSDKCKFVWRKESGEKDNKYLCEFD